MVCGVYRMRESERCWWVVWFARSWAWLGGRACVWGVIGCGVKISQQGCYTIDTCLRVSNGRAVMIQVPAACACARTGMHVFVLQGAGKCVSEAEALCGEGAYAHACY